MKLFLLALITSSFIVNNCAKYSYERGQCEVSLFEVVEDILRNEMRALINPDIRRSNNKYLQYDLYTPLNPYERQIINLGDEKTLKKSFFNPKWPVRFSIHGWTGKSTSCSNAAIKDAYIARGNFNVFIVDWSTYSLDISYPRLSKQLTAIANTFVKFTRFLHQQTGAPFENMYLIGHSAGSHIAGLAGKILKPERYGAIFALDPAGLTQLRLSEQYRLAPTDAIYVESIHTDVTLLGNPNTDLSQASFFVNWGQGQPQCPNATATEFDLSCDHFASIYYFAESLRQPKIFGALKCKKPHSYSQTQSQSKPHSHSYSQSLDKLSCRCSNGEKSCMAEAFMGGEPAIPKSGVYYLSTNEQPPFGYGRTVRIRKPIQPTYLKSRYKPKSLLQKLQFSII